MTQYFGLDWLATCLTFAAIYRLGNKDRSGFVVKMLGKPVLVIHWRLRQHLCHGRSEARVLRHERARFDSLVAHSASVLAVQASAKSCRT
jgi:hypothetical protein